MNRNHMSFRQNYSTEEKETKDGLSSIFPRWFIILYALFCFYLVVPIVDVPLLGLSLSAPIFFMLAVHAVVKPPSPWLKKYEKWFFMAAFIWVGIASSFIVNELIGSRIDFNRSGMSTIVHYAYWMLVFVITTYLCSHKKMLLSTIKWLGWGVVIVALLRWFEALFLGRIGYWSGTQLFSQNMYGFLFSAFSPFAYASILEKGGKSKGLRILSIILIWSASAINASRGSWVSMAGGIVLLLLFLLISKPKRFAGIVIAIFVAVSVTGLLILFIPEFSQSFMERFETFGTLEEDKTFLVRQVLNRKSLFLFKESPLFGAGTSRYRDTSVALETPQLLSGSSTDRINRKSSHNSYLGFLAENGLAGAIPLGFLLLYLSIKGSINVFHGIKQDQYWALYCFLAFVQMSAHLWVMAGLTGTSTWFIYGLVGAVIVKNEKLSDDIAA